MLHRLIVENLKGFGPRQEVELAPLTLIYGPNSGGKSTLIQALLLLKQTVSDRPYERAGLITQGSLVNLGSFPAAIHGQDVNQTMRIGITYSAPEEDYARFGQPFDEYGMGVRQRTLPYYERTLWEPGERVNLEFGFAWNEQGKAVYQTEVVLEIEHRSPVCRFLVDQWGGVLSLANAESRTAWNMWMDRELQGKVAWMREQPPLTPEHDLFTQDYQRREQAAWELDPTFDYGQLFPGKLLGHRDMDQDDYIAGRHEYPYEGVVRSTWSSLVDYYGGDVFYADQCDRVFGAAAPGTRALL